MPLFTPELNEDLGDLLWQLEAAKKLTPKVKAKAGKVAKKAPAPKKAAVAKAPKKPISKKAAKYSKPKATPQPAPTTQTAHPSLIRSIGAKVASHIGKHFHKAIQAGARHTADLVRGVTFPSLISRKSAHAAADAVVAAPGHAARAAVRGAKALGGAAKRAAPKVKSAARKVGRAAGKAASAVGGAAKIGLQHMTHMGKTVAHHLGKHLAKHWHKAEKMRKKGFKKTMTSLFGPKKKKSNLGIAQKSKVARAHKNLLGSNAAKLKGKNHPHSQPNLPPPMGVPIKKHKNVA